MSVGVSSDFVSHLCCRIFNIYSFSPSRLQGTPVPYKSPPSTPGLPPLVPGTFRVLCLFPRSPCFDEV